MGASVIRITSLFVINGSYEKVRPISELSCVFALFFHVVYLQYFSFFLQKKPAIGSCLFFLVAIFIDDVTNAEALPLAKREGPTRSKPIIMT